MYQTYFSPQEKLFICLRFPSSENVQEVITYQNDNTTIFFSYFLMVLNHILALNGYFSQRHGAQYHKNNHKKINIEKE